MLEKRHGFTAEQMLEYRTKLMARFRNPYIIDSVTRVGREPIRKLSPKDRIIAPMRYARQYGLDTPNYYTGIASVLLYDNPEDAQSCQLQQLIAAQGVEAALEQICGLPDGGEDALHVAGEYCRLRQLYR